MNITIERAFVNIRMIHVLSIYLNEFDLFLITAYLIPFLSESFWKALLLRKYFWVHQISDVMMNRVYLNN